MKITLDMLVKAGACAEQVELFKQHFGKEVSVTKERALAVASVFSWDWAADNLLTRAQRETYYAACAAAEETYNAACAPARKTYDAARAAALETYNAARAVAFVDAYNS